VGIPPVDGGKRCAPLQACCGGEIICDNDRVKSKRRRLRNRRRHSTGSSLSPLVRVRPSKLGAIGRSGRVSHHRWRAVFIVADGPGPVHPSRCIAVVPGRQARLERPRRPRFCQPPVRFNLPSSGSPGLFRSASMLPIISAAARIASGVRSRARWPRSLPTRPAG